MRAAVRKKPQSSVMTSIPVPTAGWISNRNLALPAGQGGQGAQVMDNWFPTASSAKLRRGATRHATLAGGFAVESLMGYSIGPVHEIFAGNAAGIYNVTTSLDPNTPIPVGDRVWPSTDGDWVSIQFSTAGGTFLIGVNGKDEGFLYNGTTFAALAVTFPAGSSLTTADLSFVWAYKQRIYFVAKDSLDAYYLPVDQIGGALVRLPLGGVFNRGGSLLWGQTWSLSTGGDGGLSEQNAFTTTEGEVVIYQGLSPDSADTWSKVGVYRVGKPMGKRAFIRAGGDLVVATTIGFIPLSKAIDMDFAALGVAAVSASIADEWRDTVSRRGSNDWVCELWGEGSMTVISPPRAAGTDPVCFVANSDTGAWCRFVGWNPTSIEVSNGRMFFGLSDGRIQQAWVGGSDEDQPYSGLLVPLFSDLGTPGQRKMARVARSVKRSNFPTRERVTAIFDWSEHYPNDPDATAVPAGNEWGNAIWGESLWGAGADSIISDEWRSVGGYGYAVSIVLQVTSASPAPLDVELIRIDFTYDIAGVIS